MLTNENCIFCKIVAGQLPSAKVYEDEQALVFMNLQQMQPGHCLVIPKEHYENIFEIPDDLLGQVSKLSAKIARAVKKAYTAEGIHLLQNNGTAAWQSVPHLHQHVIPRYPNDIGYDLIAIWTKGTAASSAELETNAAKIRQALI